MLPKFYDLAEADLGSSIEYDMAPVNVTFSNPSAAFSAMVVAASTWATNKMARPIVTLVDETAGTQTDCYVNSASAGGSTINLTPVASPYFGAFPVGSKIQMRVTAAVLDRFVVDTSAKSRKWNLYNTTYGMNFTLGVTVDDMSSQDWTSDSYDSLAKIPDPDGFANDNLFLIGQVAAYNQNAEDTFSANTHLGLGLDVGGSNNVSVGSGARVFGNGNVVIGAGTGGNANVETEGQVLVGAQVAGNNHRRALAIGYQQETRMPFHAGLAGVPWFDGPNDALGLNSLHWTTYGSAVTRMPMSRIRPSPAAGRYSTINLEESFYIIPQELMLLIGTMPGDEPTVLEVDIGTSTANGSNAGFVSFLPAPLSLGALAQADDSAKSAFHFRFDKVKILQGQFICVQLLNGTIDFRIYPHLTFSLGK